MHPTRIFKKPSELNEAWQNYKKHLEQEAIKWAKVQYVGKEAQRVTDAPPMPYTFSGFKVWARREIGCVEQYFTNQDDCYDDFIGICSHIKEEIRDNQITGGLLGVFNASITQRLNNLKEQTENVNRNDNRTILNIDPLSSENE